MTDTTQPFSKISRAQLDSCQAAAVVLLDAAEKIGQLGYRTAREAIARQFDLANAWQRMDAGKLTEASQAFAGPAYGATVAYVGELSSLVAEAQTEMVRISGGLCSTCNRMLETSAQEAATHPTLGANALAASAETNFRLWGDAYRQMDAFARSIAEAARGNFASAYGATERKRPKEPRRASA